LRNRGMNW